MVRDSLNGRWLFGLCLLFSILHLTCCDRKKALLSEPATGQVEIQVVWPGAKIAWVVYDSLTVTVSGGEMVPMRRVFVIRGRQVTWKVDQVPVGRRTVELEVFGRKEEEVRSLRLYQSAGEVTVLKKQTQTLILKLNPVNVEVNGGVLHLSVDTLQVGDTLRVEVRNASSRHTRPQFQWDWGDGHAESSAFQESGWHVYTGTGTYTLQASVYDSVAPDQPQKQKAQVVVLARNRPPEAVATSNAPVVVDSTLVLDGSGSSDPEGGTLQFAWAQLSGPVERPIRDPDVAVIEIDSLTVGQYRFRLVVRDPQGLADTVQVEVEVLSRPNQAPVAVAEDDQLVLRDSWVVLDGSASYDPEGDELAFSWEQMGGPPVSLSDTQTARPFFTAADTGTYVFRLVVGDGERFSDPKEVQVKALFLLAQTGTEGGADTLGVRLAEGRIPLDGSRSQPQDRDLVYHWEQVRDEVALRPEFRGAMARFVDLSVMGTLPDNDRPSARQISFEPSEGRGLYVFALSVGVEALKEELRSSPDTLYVFVRSAPPKVTGVDAPDSVRVGQAVMMKVQGSDDLGDALRFRWRGQQAGLLPDTTGVAPVFTPESPGIYQFSVVAIDRDPQESAPFEVTVVTVRNQPPVANAGPDQIVNIGVKVTLNGSGSYDPEGNALTYRWTAPSGITLSSTTAVRPTFTANAKRTYRFTLVVNDGQMDSAPDEVVVTVRNRVPVANAGVDQTVNVGATVTLDGSGSSDADGDELTYRWSAPTGVVLSNTAAIRPTFTAGKGGTYRFTLVVNDGQLNSAPDEVVVTVNSDSIMLSITTPLEINNVGPNATVQVNLAVAGVINAKQYGITAQVTPADAFNLDATTYMAGNESFLVPGKEVDDAEGTVRIGAANLGGSVTGNLDLGTFTFTTNARFTTTTQATIKIVFFSIGPSSSSRTIFDESQLNLMVTINATISSAVGIGGTNNGFTASVNPTSVKNPRVGQIIDIEVSIQNATQAKGALITAKYDAAIFEFVNFTPGTLIPGLFYLLGTPALGDDGLTEIQVGGTQLGGNPASGSGLLGTITFKVVSDIPQEGAFISFVDILIQASASDKSNLLFGVGEFGVKIYR